MVKKHYPNIPLLISLLLLVLTGAFVSGLRAQLQPLVPLELRGDKDYEREGLHDANNIRTLFYNISMVGNYPDDPLNVDLSVFHSVEIPKGSGENYSDGTTPFVLAKVTQGNGQTAYIMETGYRERQGTSPWFNRTMRFEPRPGYFQQDPNVNQALSPAISNDPRTWPYEWIDKINDPDDPGWPGSWNGYFGKAPAADQESFVVYDDQYYDAWDYFPDNRDAGQAPLERRRGLGLRIEQRGFQWANPQAGNVIFWHYEITNEGTTDYDDNIIFGLYMDSGVGGSAVGLDGIPESDDDNAYWDKEIGINLVYTWDKNGNGVQGPTGYLGYSYLETPGNPFDDIDNDDDGIIDEVRDGGPGQLIEGQENIVAWAQANYDLEKFELFHGPIVQRPAFRQGFWWTGDEDMDWIAEFDDTGADGVFDTDDTGERDGIPTNGEPNFDKTDVDESDQIGLTGFKMNRIRPGVGNPSTVVDQIVFFDDGKQWPQRLWDFFTSDTSFDAPLVLNYNIGFLFASGPFKLPAGKTERFSLAMAFGQDLRELKNTVKVVNQIYKSNYQFAVPPPAPHVEAFAGDGFVTLSWDDRAERAYDPVTNTNDFEGYRIYRSTDPDFLDPKVIYTATGTGPIGNGKPVAQFDLVNEIEGFSRTTVEGVAYFLGDNSGLMHTYTDREVTNGQLYYYAVCAYDRGSDSLEIYPSENAITVSRTLRGGTILPVNVVEVRPNPPARGYTAAQTGEVERVAGAGVGSVSVQVINPAVVPNDHTFELRFFSPEDSVHATNYGLFDVSSDDTLFLYGKDFDGEGRGPIGGGVLPVVKTLKTMEIDTANSVFTPGSATNINLKARYVGLTSPDDTVRFDVNLRRPGYPEDLQIIFSDQIIDTSLGFSIFPPRPVKFTVIAKNGEGDLKMKFRFSDTDNDNTLSNPDEKIEIVTATAEKPHARKVTWSVSIDTTGLQGAPIQAPTLGDVYELKLRLPFTTEDLFRFKTVGQYLNAEAARSVKDQPYVVPNPYLGAASFEPQRFAVSGRGERRIEFRSLPHNCTIRIFTINGELVKTLQHSGAITEGYLSWDLRSKDNLEIAPGLYIFQVEAPDFESYIGKFAILK